MCGKNIQSHLLFTSCPKDSDRSVIKRGLSFLFWILINGILIWAFGAYILANP